MVIYQQEDKSQQICIIDQEFIDDTGNWRVELGAFGKQPGYYRIYDAHHTTTRNLDISLDGYVLDADRNGDVIKNNRGDGREFRLDSGYYEQRNGEDEHILKSNYYQNHPSAREQRQDLAFYI